MQRRGTESREKHSSRFTPRWAVPLARPRVLVTPTFTTFPRFVETTLGKPSHVGNYLKT